MMRYKRGWKLLCITIWMTTAINWRLELIRVTLARRASLYPNMHPHSEISGDQWRLWKSKKLWARILCWHLTIALHNVSRPTVTNNLHSR